MNSVLQAIQQNDLVALRRLMDTASPNDERGGEVPLATAIRYNNTDAMRLLLGAGADPLLQTARLAESPWSMAVASFISEGNEDPLDVLMQAGVSVDAPINNGSVTPLMLAAHGSLSATKHLLTIGGDLERRDANGWTPLMYSVAVDSCDGDPTEAYERVRCLLEAGANPRVVDNAGTGVLQFAESQREHVAESIVRLLRDKLASC